MIPAHVMTRLNERTNVRSRTEAVEELRKIVQATTNFDASRVHLPDFLQFLSTLLEEGATFQVSSFSMLYSIYSTLCSFTTGNRPTLPQRGNEGVILYGLRSGNRLTLNVNSCSGSRMSQAVNL